MKRWKKIRSLAANLFDRLFPVTYEVTPIPYARIDNLEMQMPEIAAHLTSLQVQINHVGGESHRVNYLCELEVDAIRRVITRMENRLAKLEISNKCHRAELQKCKTRLNDQHQIINSFKMSIINPSMN